MPIWRTMRSSRDRWCSFIWRRRIWDNDWASSWVAREDKHRRRTRQRVQRRRWRGSRIPVTRAQRFSDIPSFVCLHIRPRRLRIVGEDHQPFFWDGLGVKLLLVIQRIKRVEVERHAPRDIEVLRGGNQVGDVARLLALALDD